MKREIEEDTRAVTTFFNLDECIDILCLPVPSPCFVAKLLQLSKRIRFQLWKFLVEPEKGDYEWVHEFCHALWRHKNKRNCLPVPHDYAGYPLFVSPKFDNDRDCFTSYFVAKKLYGAISSYLVAKRVITENEPPYDVILEREHYQRMDRHRCFNWFIVARALNIRVDAIIQAQVKPIISSGGTIFCTDTELLIQ